MSKETAYLCSMLVLWWCLRPPRRLVQREGRGHLAQGCPFGEADSYRTRLSLERTNVSHAGSSFHRRVSSSCSVRLFSKGHHVPKTIAHPLTQEWRRRICCRWTRPPTVTLVARVPVAGSRSTRPAVTVVTATAASTSASTSALTASSWLGNRCRPRKPWRDLPRERRSSRPGQRRTARDYL